jgi:pantoate--beta-alanine ligase
MSSRNTRLSASQRQRALEIPRALLWAQQSSQDGQQNVQSVIAEVRNRLASRASLKVDYVAVVDRQSLAQATEINSESQLLVAAFVDEIRLIDNVRLLGARLEIS